MFRLNQYVAAKSLDQAYELLVKDKKNTILGGLLWMKMGDRQYQTGIDLSGLGLDQIRETDDAIEIGCMTTLRQMETSQVLAKWVGPLFAQAFQYIVGVQFRNCATLGGSVYPRFGFSDVLTSLLLLNPRVELFKSGGMTLKQFIELPGKRDILVKVIIDKEQWQTSYQSQRKSATDFPILSAAVGRVGKSWQISIGARPGRAKQAVRAAGILPVQPKEDQINAAAQAAAQELSFGSDSRADESFRTMLAEVFVKRGIQQICR